jgi:hypothetical protein
MADDRARSFYLSMLNALEGLRDDLDANEAPETAKALMIELIAECRSDFRVRFSEDEAGR